MKRKVPYAIMICIIMGLLALSSTLASAAIFGSYGDQSITAFEPRLTGESGTITLFCNWNVNNNAKEQSNLTVEIFVNDVSVGSEIDADGYQVGEAAWKLDNAGSYFPAAGTYTVKVVFENSGESPSNSTTANNNLERILSPPESFFQIIINGFGYVTYTIETLTDQVPFDIPIIGPYLAYIIVFIVIVIIVWYLLKRRKKKKLAAAKPAVYRAPEIYTPPPPQQQYYRRF